MKAIADFFAALAQFIDAILKLGLGLIMLAVILVIGGCMVSLALGV